MRHGAAGSWRSLTCLLALSLFAVPVARALRPADQNARYEVPLPTVDLYRDSGERTPGASEALRQMTERYGGLWRLYAWNRFTDSPHALYGSGVALARAGEAADHEALARQVIAETPQVLRADLRSLRHTATRTGLGKTAVHFQQVYQGVPVWGGRVHLTFTDEGRLFALGSDFYRDIDLDPTPGFSAAEAAAIARADLPFDATRDHIEGEPELLVLPVPRGTAAVDHHLVWRVRVHTHEPIGIWVTHVDAQDGTLLWRYNDVHFLDYQGEAHVEAQRISYCSGAERYPLRHVRVTIPGVDTTVTAKDGTWSLPAGLTDSAEVVVDLYGPYADISNQMGPEAEFRAITIPGQPLEILFDDVNAQHDERDAFDAVSDCRDLLHIIDPDFSYIQQRIYVRVSVYDYCNAYWNGDINLFQEGYGCANTGEIQSVTHHEYGHGVQDCILGGWQGEQGCGEANADVLANLITQEPIIARGFYLGECESGLRTSDNPLVYPTHVIGMNVHAAGRVLAGFHWDVMRQLQGLYGPDEGMLSAAERWHYCRLLEIPYLQPDQVLAMFIADDNDGNLENGTPHYDHLCWAAERHGFTCPVMTEGLLIEHAPLESRLTGQPAEVRAAITSTAAPLALDSLRVRYSIDGGPWQTAALAPTVTPDTYAATLPDLQAPMEIAYYLEAEDLAGHQRTDPALAPEVVHRFDVATLFEPFEDGAAGWVANAEGLDDALSGHWTLCDPNGTAAQPENDHTLDPGVTCWVTGNAPPGASIGTNDVDWGTTSLYSPVYDLRGAHEVRVKYWRWYSNNLGNPADEEDLWVVQVRNRSGPWIDLERTIDDQNCWVERVFDLRALFGNALAEVQLRALATDVGGTTLVEATWDDFTVLAHLGSAAASPEGEADALRFAFPGSRANPVTGATALRFQVPARVAVRLDLYDVTGRLVRTLAHGTYGAGTHQVDWDGRRANGAPVASGIYYCRLQAGTYQATRTLVVSR